MNRAPDRLWQRSRGLSDVFVRYSYIDGYGFRSLEEGHQVEFEET
jgi:cold shock CspA family protein